MTSIEAYENYLSLVNKNNTNSGIKIPKGRFVILFNRESKIWLAEKMKLNNSSDSQTMLQELMTVDQELNKIKDSLRFSEFELPSDLFKYETSFSIATKENYKERVLHNWDFKYKNVEVLLQDENFNPSFDYEETLIQIAGNKALVYKTDFNIQKLFLTYYRKPTEIDIIGYTKIDGSDSKTINPDYSDYIVDQILNRCALETIRRYENPDGAQLAADRTNREN